MKINFKICLKMLLGLAFLMTLTSGKVEAQSKFAMDNGVRVEVTNPELYNYLLGLRLRYGSFKAEAKGDSVKYYYDRGAYLVDSGSTSQKYEYTIISTEDTLMIIPLNKRLLTNNKPCMLKLYQKENAWIIEEWYNNEMGSFYFRTDSSSEKNPRANWELLMKRLETWRTRKGN